MLFWISNILTINSNFLQSRKYSMTTQHCKIICCTFSHTTLFSDWPKSRSVKIAPSNVLHSDYFSSTFWRNYCHIGPHFWQKYQKLWICSAIQIWNIATVLKYSIYHGVRGVKKCSKLTEKYRKTFALQKCSAFLVFQDVWKYEVLNEAWNFLIF